MDKPKTISILDHHWQQAESFEQFRYQEEKDRSRRLGLSFFLLYHDEEDPTDCVLIQQQVSKETDQDWLKTAIDMGLIYLQKSDFDITKSAIRK